MTCTPSSQLPVHPLWGTWTIPRVLCPHSLWEVHQSCQLLPHTLVTCVGRVELWASTPPRRCHPTREVRGPLHICLQVRGFTPGHKPQEAFCHLPELQKAREAALSALGKIPYEIQTQRPMGHSALPSSSSEIVMPSLSSQHLAPMGIGESRSWFSVKYQFFLLACYCARLLVTVPVEASGCGA